MGSKVQVSNEYRVDGRYGYDDNRRTSTRRRGASLMTLESPQVEIDAVDFQISCRRFTVRATITRDRQLPVVDEFVLRLLAVLDRMPTVRMRAWFGFSQK